MICTYNSRKKRKRVFNEPGLINLGHLENPDAVLTRQEKMHVLKGDSMTTSKIQSPPSSAFCPSIVDKKMLPITEQTVGPNNLSQLLSSQIVISGYQTRRAGGDSFVPALGPMSTYGPVGAQPGKIMQPLLLKDSLPAVIPVNNFPLPPTSRYHMHQEIMKPALIFSGPPAMLPRPSAMLPRASSTATSVKLAARPEPANLVAPANLAARPQPANLLATANLAARSQPANLMATANLVARSEPNNLVVPVNLASRPEPVSLMAPVSSLLAQSAVHIFHPPATQPSKANLIQGAQATEPSKANSNQAAPATQSSEVNLTQVATEAVPAPPPDEKVRIQVLLKRMGITEDELIKLTTPDKNRLFKRKRLTPEDKKIVTAWRRTHKNRGYAKNCRIKKMTP